MILSTAILPIAGAKSQYIPVEPFTSYITLTEETLSSLDIEICNNKALFAEQILTDRNTITQQAKIAMLGKLAMSKNWDSVSIIEMGNIRNIILLGYDLPLSIHPYMYGDYIYYKCVKQAELIHLITSPR